MTLKFKSQHTAQGLISAALPLPARPLFLQPRTGLLPPAPGSCPGEFLFCSFPVVSFVFSFLPESGAEPRFHTSEACALQLSHILLLLLKLVSSLRTRPPRAEAQGRVLSLCLVKDILTGLARSPKAGDSHSSEKRDPEQTLRGNQPY